MSGYAFHRRLLHHLNVQKDSADRDTGTKPTAVFEPAPADPPSIWLKDFPAKFSLIKLLWDVLFMHIVRLLYKGSIMFDDLPIDRSATALEQRKGKDTQYCKTAIRSLRIPSPLLSELLSECRRHDTTLGSLLHVVSVSTMATDIYPNSKITLAASPISGRPWAVPVQGPDLLVNSVGSNMRIRRLEQYRATTRPPAGHASGIYVNADRTWALSTAYTKHFRQGLSSLSMFNGSLAGVIYSDEIENVYKNYFPNLWLYQRYFTLVSNLGAFATDTKIGPWDISDVQFSAAAVKSNWGFVAPVFNVSSVRGGDCVITCSMEKGLIRMQVIERILAAMEKRLSLLLTPEREP